MDDIDIMNDIDECVSNCCNVSTPDLNTCIPNCIGKAKNTCGERYNTVDSLQKCLSNSQQECEFQCLVSCGSNSDACLTQCNSITQ